MQNPFRGEIQEVLRSNARTRYAKVLLGMERGLTDEQMAEEADRAGEPAQPATIRRAREAVRMTLDDELAADKDRAGSQGGLYRELLNYSLSLGLRQHVVTRIAQLQKINPQISAEPLNDVPSERTTDWASGKRRLLANSALWSMRASAPSARAWLDFAAHYQSTPAARFTDALMTFERLPVSQSRSRSIFPTVNFGMCKCSLPGPSLNSSLM